MTAKVIDKTLAQYRNRELTITPEGQIFIREIVNTLADVFSADLDSVSLNDRLYYAKYLKRFLAADCVQYLSEDNRVRAEAAVSRTSANS